MNVAAAQIELPEDAILPVLDQVDADPKLLLLGKADKQAYLDQLRAAVWPDDGDIATKAGRDRIKSNAQAVRTRKAAIDRTRKEMTEAWRSKTATVNEVGKDIIASLDALIEEVRAPVTAWEDAETRRIAEADAILAELEATGTITYGTTSADVQDRLDRIRGINLNPEVLGVRIDMATDMRDQVVAVLARAVTDLKAQEEQARELERLRAQAALAEERRQREEQERHEAAAREAAAKAEAERIERAQQEAAERARREAEEVAERERQERERAAQAEIDAANARAAEAERAAQAERDRISREEAERKERAEAEAEAQRQREADLAHRQQVIETAADAITALGLTKKLAMAVVNAISAGNVPAVRITF